MMDDEKWMMGDLTFSGKVLKITFLSNPFMLTPQETVNLLADIDMTYLQGWLDEAENLELAGFYDRVASIIQTNGDGGHLDVGCGLGHLLGKLALRRFSGPLVGVDVVPKMLFGAKEVLKAANLDPVLSFTCEYVADGTPGIGWRREFVDHESFEVVRPGVISLIGDDINSSVVLRRLLGGHRLGSGSMLLPGGPQSLVMENSGGSDFRNHEARRNRMIELMANTRRSTYKFMAENIRPGGQLVLAERALWHEKLDMSLLDDSFPGLERKYWTGGRLGILRLGSGSFEMVPASADAPKESLLQRAGGGTVKLIGRDGVAVRDGGEMAIFVRELIRNDRPYSNEMMKSGR